MLNRFLHNSVSQRCYLLLKTEKSLNALLLSKHECSRYNPTNIHIHTSPQNRNVVVSHENNYILNVIDKIQLIHSRNSDIFNHEVNSLEEFNSILDQNWRNLTAPQIVEAFKNVKRYCVQHNINISDKRFDNLVDGVMDNCEHFTKSHIIELLNCLAEMPLTPGYNCHNFHDLWSCLDDICCWKMVDWDVNTSLEIAKLWSKLHLGLYVHNLLNNVSLNSVR